MLFKIETEEGNGIWTDVRDADGKILTFDSQAAAQAKLAELFPVLVKMESYAGGKRTRVVQIFRSDAEWKDGTPPK